ncbi:hypothetical protein M9H77_09522 [Catharanthus roseus]|uniref:Uncharacterized protein n=1 Tax=Catharanthus roseus TaxID=4058 RepID=A0ACC0C109_CATRO|nr:hypothetical protein M9H77_09522 [Catharanthus roseus]
MCRKADEQPMSFKEKRTRTPPFSSSLSVAALAVAGRRGQLQRVRYQSGRAKYESALFSKQKKAFVWFAKDLNAIMIAFRGTQDNSEIVEQFTSRHCNGGRTS